MKFRENGKERKATLLYYYHCAYWAAVHCRPYMGYFFSFIYIY